MSKRDDYQKQMEEQLDLWGARLDALKTRTGGLAKVDDPKEHGAWRVKGDAARAKLAELTASSGDRWDVIKIEMETAWQGLDAAVRQAPPASSA